MSGPLLAVDGDSFAHRAYHALPKSLRRGDGGPAGALIGFANLVLRLCDATTPRAVLVAWDTLGAPTYRNEAFPAYQAGREFDEAIVEQLGLLPELCAALGLAVAKGAGYEADDFLAAAARSEEERGGTCAVATSDRDAFQLASARTTILQPGGGGFTPVGPPEVRERYGVEPSQVPDFIALRGDPSDGLPGARGIGAKRAAALLAEHADLEAILAAGLLAGQADELRLYRRIATMDGEAPLPPLPDRGPDWAGGARLAASWGLGNLAGRLEARAAG